MTFALLPDGRAHWHLREERWSWIPDPESTAVLSLDGMAVSVCRLFSRKLNSFEIQLDAYGIGGVYTAPGYRGKGYASRLLRELTAALWRGAATALCLYATNAKSLLYQRNGFLEVQPGLYAKALLPGMTFLPLDWRINVTPWQVWPEGHF